MGKMKDLSIPDESEYVEDMRRKEMVGRWKIRKKKGGMKWVWKRRKVKPLSISETQNASPADSDHTTAPTTDGDARHAG